MQIVKVQYYSETTGEMSARSYTYFSEDTLKVGDIVIVPVKDTTGKAKVCAVDVPEAEIQAFRDKVKTIPAGSVVPARVAPAPGPVVEPSAGPYGVQDEPVSFGFGSEPQGSSAHIDNPMVELETDLAAGSYHGEEHTEVATIKVKPEDDPKVVALATEARQLRDFAVARTIGTDADLKPATEDLSIIARVKKALTEAKALYVKPIRGHLDDVNAAFTSILAPLDEADKVTRDKILAYRQAQQKRAAEVEKLNQDAADVARRQAELSGTGEFTVNTTPVVAPAPVKRVSTDLGTASVQKIVRWEVVDKSLVPEDYKILDAGKITKLVKGGGTLPGIKVIIDEGLRVTTR